MTLEEFYAELRVRTQATGTTWTMIHGKPLALVTETKYIDPLEFIHSAYVNLRDRGILEDAIDDIYADEEVRREILKACGLEG